MRRKNQNPSMKHETRDKLGAGSSRFASFLLFVVNYFFLGLRAELWAEPALGPSVVLPKNRIPHTPKELDSISPGLVMVREVGVVTILIQRTLANEFADSFSRFL